jgi:hypothetical protein
MRITCHAVVRGDPLRDRVAMRGRIRLPPAPVCLYCHCSNRRLKKLKLVSDWRDQGGGLCDITRELNRLNIRTL